MAGRSLALAERDTEKTYPSPTSKTKTAEFNIWTILLLGYIHWCHSRNFEGDFQPSINCDLPPKGKQEKPLTALTCLCHLVYSYRATYGISVLPFSSEIGIQATQALIWGMTTRRRTTTLSIVACFYGVGATIRIEILIQMVYTNLMKFPSIFNMFHLRYLSFLMPYLKRLFSDSPCKIPRGM